MSITFLIFHQLYKIFYHFIFEFFFFFKINNLLMDNIKSMYIMMVSVAFIDGALRITNIPTFYLWKDFLHVTPGVNCLLRYVTKLPWCIKPVFAYFSDRHYIWGYRTKIYFIITGIIETISFLLLGIQVKSVLYTTVLVFIH